MLHQDQQEATIRLLPLGNGMLLIDSAFKFESGAWFDEEELKVEKKPRAEIALFGHGMVFSGREPVYVINHAATGLKRYGVTKHTLGQAFSVEDGQSKVLNKIMVFACTNPIISDYIQQAMEMWASRDKIIIPYNQRAHDRELIPELAEEYGLYRAIRALKRYVRTEALRTSEQEGSAALRAHPLVDPSLIGVAEEAEARWKISKKGVSCSSMIGNAILIATARYLFKDQIPYELFERIQEIELLKRAQQGDKSLYTMQTAEALITQFAMLVEMYLAQHPPDHIPAAQLPDYVSLLVMPIKFWTVTDLVRALDVHPLWRFKGIAAVSKTEEEERIGLISVDELQRLEKARGAHTLVDHLHSATLDFTNTRPELPVVLDSPYKALADGGTASVPLSTMFAQSAQVRRQKRLTNNLETVQTSYQRLQKSLARIQSYGLEEIAFCRKVTETLTEIECVLETGIEAPQISDSKTYDAFIQQLYRLERRFATMRLASDPFIQLLRHAKGQLTGSPVQDAKLQEYIRKLIRYIDETFHPNHDNLKTIWRDCSGFDVMLERVLTEMSDEPDIQTSGEVYRHFADMEQTLAILSEIEAVGHHGQATQESFRRPRIAPIKHVAYRHLRSACDLIGNFCTSEAFKDLHYPELQADAQLCLLFNEQCSHLMPMIADYHQLSVTLSETVECPETLIQSVQAELEACLDLSCQLGSKTKIDDMNSFVADEFPNLLEVIESSYGEVAALAKAYIAEQSSEFKYEPPKPGT